LLSNMALIKSKQKDWQAVIDKSTEALNFDEKNVKSLFRRGEAHAHLGNDEESVQDLRKAAALDHADKNISTLLSAVEKRIRVEQEKQRKRFRGIFNKVSLADEENGGYTKEAKPPAPASESHSDSDDDEKKDASAADLTGMDTETGSAQADEAPAPMEISGDVPPAEEATPTPESQPDTPTESTKEKKKGKEKAKEKTKTQAKAPKKK